MELSAAEAVWRACTWDGAREDALLRGQQMTFREKIIWLENAERLSNVFKVSSAKAKTKS